MMNDELHVVHARAAGLDVHKMEVTATVRLCEGAGLPRFETRRFDALGPGLAELSGWLVGHGVEAAAMESTGVYWEAPWNALSAAGIEVQLLHAWHVKQLRGRKTDIGDSRWLARVCQLGLCQPSFVPPARFRELRPLARHRRSLAQQRSRTRNRAQKVIDRAGARVGGVLSDAFGMNGRRILDGLAAGVAEEEILASLSHHVNGKRARIGEALSLPLNDTDRHLLADLLDEDDRLDERIRKTDRLVAEALEPEGRQIELLMTVPGVDRVSARAILAETGPDVARAFGSPTRFASWAGVSPGNDESAGRRRRAPARAGSRTLRAVLVECANGAARTRDCQFHSYARALKVRRGYGRAILAVANKLARAIFAMLRDDRPYQDPETDYEALVVRRNAPRWIRQLRQFEIVKTREDGSLHLDWDALDSA